MSNKHGWRQVRVPPSGASKYEFHRLVMMLVMTMLVMMMVIMVILKVMTMVDDGCGMVVDGRWMIYNG